MTKAELISYMKEMCKVFDKEERAQYRQFDLKAKLAELGFREEISINTLGQEKSRVYIFLLIFLVIVPALSALILAAVLGISFFVTVFAERNILQISSEGKETVELILSAENLTGFRNAIISCCVCSAVGFGVAKLISYFVMRKMEQTIGEIEERNENREELQRKHGAQIEEELKKIDRVIRECQMEIDRYKTQGVLHEKYVHAGAAYYIYECLNTGRADTIKEAINLYEEHIRNEEWRAKQSAWHAEYLEKQQQILESQEQYQEDLAQLRQQVEEGQKWAQQETAVNGIISAIGTDNAIRARKEIERANGKIV